MEIKTRRQGDIDVVALNGNLDTSTAGEAEEFLLKLVAGNATKLLMNCSDLGYISSSGLRVFLVAAKQLKEKSGELRLCSLNSTVAEVFEISGFDTIFNISKSEEEALSDF